ncbi:Tda2p Ecym_3495 [Eremothecium cymbalariae DBVPG|uniref:Topoisomerase I damage affected protein 2 n=1 Tax=Eremothecium cymbalariae (strain CBS 270.75 / DBVPG 7215 / KCTC 17166 / NRRL Y-17582) TaxID=931890 RepID=G8JS57_ERECY|nr:Hypothetical protein Ecym_3495 [Eremothecium cymbalariae DBVPG\
MVGDIDHVHGEYKIYEVEENATNKNCPFTAERLREILDQEFGEQEEYLGDLTSVVERLNEISSQYKYLVNVTEVQGIGTPGMEVHGRLGASWDAERDGQLTHRVSRNDREVLISVVWISK